MRKLGCCHQWVLLFSTHAPHKVQPLLQMNVDSIVNEFVCKGCQIMHLPRMPTALGLALRLVLLCNKDEDSQESLFLLRNSFTYEEPRF